MPGELKPAPKSLVIGQAPRVVSSPPRSPFPIPLLPPAPDRPGIVWLQFPTSPAPRIFGPELSPPLARHEFRWQADLLPPRTPLMRDVK